MNSDTEEMILQEIKELRQELRDLRMMVMKEKIDATWLSEADAAKLLGYMNNRTLRRKVQNGELSILHRNNNGRRWEYSRKEIMRYKEQTALN